ncbi:MAG: hypothetical protein BMS9Abin13_111 [Patescibacteria group bacterium]|nr:MAG: hypothetical protein BMS9Abin13_111 [Patescibacteria group bacterium]
MIHNRQPTKFICHKPADRQVGYMLRVTSYKIGRYKRGVGLLELLLYIAILAIIMVAIANVFILLSRGQGQVESRTEMHSQLRFSLAKMTHDLKAASAVTSPASTSTATSTLTMTIGADTVTYDLSAGILQRTLNTGTPAQVTTDTITVATSTFTRIENTNSTLGKTLVGIQIEISADYNSMSPGSQYSASKKTTVLLR